MDGSSIPGDVQTKPYLALEGHDLQRSPPDPKYPAWHIHVWIPTPLITRLLLMGDGQCRQQGGLVHTLDALVSMYIPAGQNTVRVIAEAGDVRPSGKTARTFQRESGGPSWPLDRGEHRRVMRSRDMKVKAAG